MAKAYNHLQIEKKWQKEWEKKQPNKASDTSKQKKFYPLIEFPYPSGDGLHVGHIRSNTAMDIVARKRRAEGYNVLYPIGWDAFGLPTENYAIKTGIQPAVVTKKNTDTFRRQLKSLGFSFDWSREINTTDPAYFKWTQWIFLQFYKKGLAYKKKMTINWCPKDKIGLANEEVVDGKCERCGTPVEKREKEQWMLAITKYADRLEKDLDTVNYLEKIKIQQKNWIGKSEGAEFNFAIQNSKEKIKVFTTRADTLFGVTYVVLAPEHELVTKLQSEIKNWNEVEAYISEVKNKDEMVRTAADKEKTGVELKGIKAVHPATGEQVPVWIADYVLASYGTGAVMAVPAHDERDFVFAKKYGLEVKYVVAPHIVEEDTPLRSDRKNVYRKAVDCYVKNPRTGQFLCLKHVGVDWTSMITGGIDEGENPIEAGKREVREETGYKNLRFIKVLGSPLRVDFYHPPKDENRFAEFTGLYFELENEEKDEVSETEIKKHTSHWIDEDKVLDFINKGHLFFTRLLSNDTDSYTDEGIIINSADFGNVLSANARKEIAVKYGRLVTTYKLRDWVFSRQRYWGEPIPMIWCEACALKNGGNWIPVPEKDLPVTLPKVKNYQPTDNGESPLAAISKWVNVKCPECKGPARRETDTMPNWAGSSWYFLRYVDPKNKKAFADPKKLKTWMPVDWYNGGMEHTTLHLLYSRFWHKFLYDLGVVPTPEPYQKRTSHGLILAGDGEKMSKSRGNVINPDQLVTLYGADTLRIYEMFMGPFDQAIAWSTDNMIGSRRFIERVWKLAVKIEDKKSRVKNQNAELETLINKTIKKVGEDIESMSFNTAISSMMILLNALEKEEVVGKIQYEILLRLIAPFAPHFTEELWHNLGYKTSIHKEGWPAFDAKKLQSETVRIAVQINGKTRDAFETEADQDENTLQNKAMALENVKKWMENKPVKKVIYVKNRLINIVI